MRPAGRWQAKIRPQPGQTFRLRASNHRADHYARWLSIGLRGYGRQHLGQDDAEGISGQDREAIWQGQTHLGYGSRHSDRGSVGRDAKFRNANPLSGWLAARTAHETREGVSTKHWEDVSQRARVKLAEHDGETYVLARSQG